MNNNFCFFVKSSDIPYVTVHRSIVNTREGDSAHLHCEYETTLDSEVSWLDNKGQPVNEANSAKYKILRDVANTNVHKSTLVIYKVNQGDLGKYWCKVGNELGAENVNIELTYAPEPPKLNSTEQEGESVITHWHIRSLQPLTEVKLNYRKKGVSSVDYFPLISPNFYVDLILPLIFFVFIVGS